MINNSIISSAMSIKLDKLFPVLPPSIQFNNSFRRAPKREFTLTDSETALALRNALRYIPEKWHKTKK